MSVASSSTIRALRSSSTPLFTARRAASTYTENSSQSQQYPPRQPRPYSRDREYDNYPTPRPNRPGSSVFFTGRPVLTAEIESIQQMLESTRNRLRADNLYPLPRTLTLPNPPQVSWKDRVKMQAMLNGELVGHGHHRRLTQLLNELHRATYLAQLGGKYDVAERGTIFLNRFATSDVTVEQKKAAETSLDGKGRALGSGKRKTASAQVWIIPSKSALDYLDVTAKSLASTQTEEGGEGKALAVPEIPSAEVLINHMVLPKYFQKPQDRQAVLRPFKLTGLLGAYNVFAIVKGGGTTGQAEAVAMALARALVIMRPDTKNVLFADGALMRDPRVVERKKTNMLKARKARRWVKR